MPDYRHTPEVERILQEDPLVDKKENPTQEEIEENERWWAEFRASPVVQFMTRAKEIADKLNEIELQENAVPYRKEDKKLWQACLYLSSSTTIYIAVAFSCNKLY